MSPYSDHATWQARRESLDKPKQRIGSFGCGQLPVGVQLCVVNCCNSQHAGPGCSIKLPVVTRSALPQLSRNRLHTASLISSHLHVHMH